MKVNLDGGYAFDTSDTSMEGVILVVLEGSLDDSGYGDFLDSDGEVQNCHYRDANRFTWESDARKAVRSYKNGGGRSICDTVRITCQEDDDD